MHYFSVLIVEKNKKKTKTKAKSFIRTTHLLHNVQSTDSNEGNY